MKRESVKDYKCFFYQYSESSYLQLKTLTNVQLTMQWYQVRMTSLYEGAQVPVINIRRNNPTQIFDGSQLLNVSVEQPILKA